MKKYCKLCNKRIWFGVFCNSFCEKFFFDHGYDKPDPDPNRDPTK